MRVLMVTPCYYPTKGGTETVVHNFTTELHKIGIQADVMAFNMFRKWSPLWRGETVLIDGARVFRIPGLNWLPIAHSPLITMNVNLIPGRFRQLLKDYDIIHFHEELSFPLFSFLANKPRLFQFHGWVPECPETTLEVIILRNIADRYLCLTDKMAENVARMGVPREKLRILPNGVDVEFFTPPVKEKENIILYVGRINPEKGVHVLLKSLSYLRKATKLVIVGPPGWDKQFFLRMLSLFNAENQKGLHKVTYLGEQDQTSLVEYYRKASLFVLPSFMEGFPVVNLEALACGTPVIASNVGGIPATIHDGENGLLVPPNDASELARAIEYMLENDDVRKRFGRAGRELVTAHFSLQVVTGKLCRIYKELIA